MYTAKRRDCRFGSSHSVRSLSLEGANPVCGGSLPPFHHHSISDNQDYRHRDDPRGPLPLRGPRGQQGSQDWHARRACITLAGGRAGRAGQLRPSGGVDLGG
eukprot:2105366-Pyramimonas_sp.AAC.1